jgi:hypothetical protein
MGINKEDPAMKHIVLVALFLALFFGSGLPARAAQFPNNFTWTTVLTAGQIVDGVTVGTMEGLTGDNDGNFYVADHCCPN